MRKVLKWTKRIVIGLVSVVLLVVGIAVIILHTDFGRRMIQERAQAALRETFPGGARVGKITGSIFGTLVVEDLVINGEDGKPWIAAGQAKLKLSILPFLRKTARVDWIELDDLVIDQHPQPPPKPRPLEPEGKPSTWTVELPRIVVHRGRFVLATKTRTFDFQHLDATGSVSVDDGAVTITAGVAGSFSGKPVVAASTFRIANGQIAFPYAHAEIDQGRVLALGARITDELDGVIFADLPVATARLIAQVELPGDAQAVVVAHGGAIDAHIAMAGATARALVETNFEARTGRGVIVAEIPDATRLDRRVAGSGIVTAMLEGGVDHVRGIVTLDGIRPVDPVTVGRDTVHGRTLVAVDATLEKAWVYLQGAVDLGGGHVTGIAEATRDKATGVVTLTKSTLVATARNVGARRGKTDLSLGSFAINARATGPVYPQPKLHIVGTTAGEALRYTTYSAETLDLRFDVTKQASGHLDVTGVRSGARLLGAVSLDAHGALTPAYDGVTIDVDSHTITTAANGTWSGNGGHIAVDPLKVIVTGFRTGNGGGSVTASLDLTRETKDFTAKVDAKQVVLATLAPDIKGTVSATAAIARKGGRWSGTGHVVASQLVAPKQPTPVDIDATLGVQGRRITLAATTTAEAGKVTVEAAVDGPYDLTDGRAWLRLDRRAIHDATLDIEHLDASKLGVANATGVVEGKLELGATSASGALHVRDVHTKRGMVSGELGIEPNGALITVKANGQLESIAGANVIADLALPEHVFDPAEWTGLGKHVLRHATIDVPAIVLDTDKLVRLGQDPTYRGTITAHVDVEEAARSASITGDVAGLIGGSIKKPLDVHVDGGIDANAHVHITARSGQQQLAIVEANVPFDLDHPADILTAKLVATVQIPKVPAPALIGIVGRNDASGGEVDGTITVGGSMSLPTADGTLSAIGIKIPSSVPGRKPAQLDKLLATVHWDGTSGTVVLDAAEEKGLLHATAEGNPRKPESLTALFNATNFDIAPITAFATGALGAARGEITAALTLQGFSTNGNLKGMLKLSGGRIPLSALLGNARSIEAEVQVANHRIELKKLSGKLGSKGEIKGTATVDLAGATPTKAHAELSIKQIQLVRALQPTIDANVVADLHGTTQWSGTVTISHAHVLVASTGGTKLLDAGAPGDIVFIDAAPDPIKPLLQRPPPDKPWLIADVILKPTTVDIIQDEFQVRGDAHGKITVSYGDKAIGVDGAIEADRGDIDLLGAHSLLDHANVIFDGTIDPLVDVRVIRDLQTMVVTADITGRASNWRLDMTSDHGSYTQGELYSFFLGGQPTGSGSEAGQAAVAAGAGYASALLTKQLNRIIQKALPINLTFNYETESAYSSKAVRIGYWYNRKLFLAARAHIEARIDENANEGVFEYHLPSNWLLQGQVGDRNYDAVDIIHRWHW